MSQGKAFQIRTNRPLGEVAYFLNGGTPRREVARYYQGSIPWITSNDLKEGVDLVTVARFHITEEAVASSATKKVPKGNVLFVSRTGVGKVAIAGMDVCISQDFTGIIPNTDLVDIRYLLRFLQAKQSYFTANQRGATIKGVTRQVLEDLSVPLPPLPEQRRIAAILDAADGLRAKRRAALGKLDGLVRGVFLEMFGEPSTNPKGWPRKTLGELGTVVTGNTPSRLKPEYYGNYIEWIKSDNISGSSPYLTRAEEGLSDVGARLGRIAPAGSILVTCIAGSPNSIGNAAIADRPVAFNQQINALIPHAEDISLFLYLQFVVGKKLVQRGSTNSMKGMVNKSAFSSIEFIDPPHTLQHRFSCYASEIIKTSIAQSLQASSLDKLFSSLQQRAFRGEL